MDKRKNCLLIGGMIVCALVLLLVSRLTAPKSGRTVLITVDGKEYLRTELGSYREITIDCGNGDTNVLVVDRDGIYMISANCRDHSCVEQGKVTPENSEIRALGPSIICLPHKVVCTLIGPGEAEPILLSDTSDN